MEQGALHPLATGHIPDYVVAADGSDFLFTAMVVFTLVLILMLGIGYFTLHALPEKMAHESNHGQFQVVGILALLALFTHNNMFWVLAVLVAGFRFPDYLTPVESIAQSLARMAGTRLVLPEGKTVDPEEAAAMAAPTEEDIAAAGQSREAAAGKEG